MKKDIHPQYYPKAKVTCVCGNEFTVGSTLSEIKTEICSMCHPFYTGKQKLVDSARRVEKFQSKIARIEKTASARKGKKVKNAARAETKKHRETKAEEK
jgi:large subunit ribosomal protein L31